MIKILSFILCIMGFHKWRTTGKIPEISRRCKRCGRRQEGSYDMLYGETIWM